MMKTTSGLLLLILALISCKKEAGDGGNSSIRGAVSKELRIVLTNPATKTGTYPAADQDVFIIYGDHISPDDRVQTNYDGEYEFMYLRPGKYKIYTFSEDTNSVAVTWDEKHMTILQEIEITDKKQDLEAEDMTIYEQP
ncbi:MAG: hypothetical protein K1X54_09400 [Flavobacteriales bacterium]|nr:hypothetical protein [Flavobacteriales bacterium]